MLRHSLAPADLSDSDTGSVAVRVTTSLISNFVATTCLHARFVIQTLLCIVLHSKRDCIAKMSTFPSKSSVAGVAMVVVGYEGRSGAAETFLR